jgi:predicted amidophosphoribosyltransferase
MSPSLIVTDCSVCRAAASVIFGTCEVCFAEFDQDDDDILSHGESVRSQ